MLDWVFRVEPLPNHFYIALVTSDDVPTEDTNTFSELTEIADGNGYDEGGYELNAGSPDFDTLTEDDYFDRAIVQIKDIIWAAEGGPIPASGNGARYVVLLEGTGESGETISERQVIAIWDMTTDKVVTDEFALRLRNLELRLIGLGVGSEAEEGAGDDTLTVDEDVPVEELFQHHETGGDSSYTIGQTDASEVCYQTFTPNISHNISRVELELFDMQENGLDGVLTVNIFATDGEGFPTGVALGSGTLDASELNPAHMSDIWEDEEVWSFASRFCFSPDGLHFFTVSLTGYGVDVYGYTLSVAFDLNTATQTSYYQSGWVWTRTINNIMFSADGTVMVINVVDSGWSGNLNFQFALSTPWNVTTAAPSSGSIYTHPDYLFYMFYGSQFSSDGTKWYMTGTWNSTQVWLLQYNLSTPWDVTTNSGDPAAQNIALYLYTASAGGCCFSEDGKKVAIIDRTNKKILFWNLPTAWTLTSESKDSYEMDISAYCEAPLQICCTPDFKTFFVGDGGTVYKFEIPQLRGDWHSVTISPMVTATAATKLAIGITYDTYEAGVNEPEFINAANGLDNYPAGTLLLDNGTEIVDS